MSATVATESRRPFLPSFSRCCTASEIHQRHELMRQHCKQLLDKFDARIKADEAQIKARLERDIEYLDTGIQHFDIASHHFNAEVEAYFERVAGRIANKLQHDKEQIKIALKHAGKELGLDLIKLLKNANIIETHLQRMCEVLIEILIQIHATNIPPIAEVQEGILGAIVALGALDLLMSGDKKLNDKIRERLGDKTVNPKYGPLGRAIVIARDDITPGISHMLLVSEAMGLVPMGSASIVQFALQDACDKALRMDQFANQKVEAAEEEVVTTFNNITSTLMVPVHYVGSWINWARGANNTTPPAAAATAGGVKPGKPAAAS